MGRPEEVREVLVEGGGRGSETKQDFTDNKEG